MVRVTAKEAQGVVDDLLADIETAVAQGVQGALEDATEYTKRLVVIDVEYGPNGVIRSVKGEPPRRDTGNLYNSIGNTDVDFDGKGRISGEVYAGASYAAVLQDVLDRPFLFGEGEDTTESEFGKGGKLEAKVMAAIESAFG